MSEILIPRIMIAAPKSGSGKTLITCALLHLLKTQGESPIAFKCGPDFIDPMFHESVLSVPSRTIDSYFCTDEQVRTLFAHNYETQKASCAVIEGVMGFFDGLAGISPVASSQDIARITQTPVILVVDASGMSRSTLALIKGFCDFDTDHTIRGVILNKTSEAQFARLSPYIEQELHLATLGFLPNNSQYVWKSRHLGLFLPHEIKNFAEQIAETAYTLSHTLNIPRLKALMCQARPLHAPKSEKNAPRSVRIGVAKDEAFCFYYADNLSLLEQKGAELVYFSPLRDERIPAVDGLLLGGGYPELHARTLQENHSMRASIRQAVKNGIPLMAECGGFMYLQERLTAHDGSEYEFCAALNGTCAHTDKLVRFGYAEFSPKSAKSSITSIKGHEFHYFDSTHNGNAFLARKPLSDRTWECMISNETQLAGFPHLYYHSNPAIADWFISACKRG